MANKELYPLDRLQEKEILCPRCNKNRYTPYGCDVEYVHGVSAPFAAVSRRDNKTYICSECGEAEAFEDFGALEKYDGPIYWEEEE